ncbi:hypothetical protein E5288_WYG012744 [Bos mutus]|uniref:Uncharacterized protein n=1 Tax=Bos mutus TaxID=72004 RepID=A0A6B0QWA2_9CETA|nr:hypothetical protein [Bos mutus]
MLALGPASRHPKGLACAELGSLRLPPLSLPELSHRCPATILGWPQTRTRIAFGQSVAKLLSSGPRSPAGFRFAPVKHRTRSPELRGPRRRSAVAAHPAARSGAGAGDGGEDDDERETPGSDRGRMARPGQGDHPTSPHPFAGLALRSSVWTR